jgi:hypothetical protein
LGVEPDYEEQPLATLTVTASASIISLPGSNQASIDDQQVAVGFSPVELPAITALAVADSLLNVGTSTPTSDQLTYVSREAF